MSWAGVNAQPHRFGGTEYRLGGREIGHIHGDHLVDIPFPKSVRNELISAGLAEPHHYLPTSGWISFRIKDLDDIERAIALLRRSYELEERNPTTSGHLSFPVLYSNSTSFSS